MNSVNDIYRKLQEHLDTMPIGFPPTKSGVELRLLQALFTPEQARIAIGLDYKFRGVEQILPHLPDCGLSAAELEARLEEMADRGNTYVKQEDGVKVYANMPLVVGMLELQVNRLSLDLLKDVEEYFQERYAGEYLRTPVRQMRVIPIQKSITADHRIGTYDELRDLIDKAEGRIRVGECMCRKGMQMAGHTCGVTTRKETCMAFRNFADLMGKIGMGQAYQQGAGPGDCGERRGGRAGAAAGQCAGSRIHMLLLWRLLRNSKMAKAMPRPAEFVVTNYYAQVKVDLCNGCGGCLGNAAKWMPSASRITSRPSIATGASAADYAFRRARSKQFSS